MNAEESPGFDISPEFIEENKKINLVKPRQKFAPYTKAQRQDRRKEVYRLHVELGLPAVKIAELMKVDRNTINSDIRTIYQDIAEPDGTVGDAYNKFASRLESQRSRLLEYLSKQQDIQTKLLIERHITDIDSRMVSMNHKIYDSEITILKQVREAINNYTEKKKLDYRVINIEEFLKVSPAAFRGILNILRKEKLIA